jgi:hypothetical protein
LGLMLMDVGVEVLVRCVVNISVQIIHRLA